LETIYFPIPSDFRKQEKSSSVKENFGFSVPSFFSGVKEGNEKDDMNAGAERVLNQRLEGLNFFFSENCRTEALVKI
jgi:glycyl-tRNA synthetase beta subunit